MKFCPCGRIRRKSAHKVVHLLHPGIPIDTAGFLENLRSRTQFFCLGQLLLRRSLDLTFQNGIHGFYYQVTAQFHQLVVHHLHIVGIGNRDTYLIDDFSGIDFMFQEKGRNSGFSLSVDDRPVDRSSPTILRQQRGMQIESSQTRHVPYHFRQHTESHHNLQVSFQSSQLFQKLFVFQLFRLEHLQSLRYGILFHWTRLQHAAMPSHRFVGHRNDPHHLIASFHQSLQTFHGKFRSTHIYDS